MATPWYRDFPLDWTRDDTRAAERLIIWAYPTTGEIVRLCQNASVDVATIDTSGPTQQVVRDVLGKAALADLLSPLLQKIVADPSKAAIRNRLQALNAGDFAAVRTETLRIDPRLAALEQLPLAMDGLGTDDATPEPLPPTFFERETNTAAKYTEPWRLRSDLTSAELRTAQIEVGGQPAGTGFLIAPDLLITNHHVVAGVDGNGRARFDRTSTNDGRTVDFAADWKVAASAPDTEAKEQSADGPPVGQWDFAVVRLAQPVGDQAIGPDPEKPDADKRGFYTLDWSTYAFNDAEPLYIVGHPDRGWIQLSDANPGGARFTTMKNRVRYRVNTSSGSSGSPVFNQAFRIVALHHMGSWIGGTKPRSVDRPC